MAEAEFMRRLMIQATGLGARLFRQNVGMAWVGKIVKKTNKIIILENPRPFHAGMKGMPDLGGWVPVKITPEMVGRTIAVYATIEVKAEGSNKKPTKDQAMFLAAVSKAGGVAGVASTEDELVKILSQTP